MKASHIAAILILSGAALWIGSGVLTQDERRAEEAQAQVTATQRPQARFRVSVVEARVENHARSIVLSGRTEADRRAVASARAAGIIETLSVKRGTLVKAGDAVAVLTDDARVAQVAEARAKLEQRKVELAARIKLIEQGNFAAINRPQLEAELRTAETGLAQAQTELAKATVRAPIAGVVNKVPVEQGQALQIGAEVAEIVALDPMLAVVEIAERQLGGIKVGDPAQVTLVTGTKAQGRVRFISRTASEQTRTYRVDVEIPNADGLIADGVTTEVSLKLAEGPASRVPRSALTFSGDGRLGVRIVETGDKVGFVPVGIAEDGSDAVWLTGLTDGMRVVVQGQDFVKEGETVEAVPADASAQAGQRR